MLNELQFLIESIGLPSAIVAAVIIVLVVLNIIGELLEAKNKVVPEFMKVRKWFIRRKKERETLEEMMRTLPEVKKSLEEFRAHYNKDNITMRDAWITSMDRHVEDSNRWKEEFCKKLDKNTQITLDIRIENMRSEIIGFAQLVSDDNCIVTHEQFDRIFRLYTKYEDILEEYDKTNGEAETAMRIIREAYAMHMKTHSFLEDMRGYPTKE